MLTGPLLSLSVKRKTVLAVYLPPPPPLEKWAGFRYCLKKTASFLPCYHFSARSMILIPFSRGRFLVDSVQPLTQLFP